jgi:nucleoid-associated protein YgaU
LQITPANGGATTQPTSTIEMRPIQPLSTTPATGTQSSYLQPINEQPARKQYNASQFKSYVVQAQDNYYNIAEKQYGSSGFYRALLEYNRQQNPSNEQLQAGGTIVIPDEQVLRDAYPDLVPRMANLK